MASSGEASCEALGDRLLAKARSSATSKNIFRGNERYSDAATYFLQASEQYALADAPEKAADALDGLISVFSTKIIPSGAGTTARLASYYDQLAAACAEFDWPRAAAAFKAAARTRMDDNNFAGAGVVFKRMAMAAEALQETKAEEEAWDNAAEAYAAAGSKSTAAQCRLAKARAYATRRDLTRASAAFAALAVDPALSLEATNCAFQAVLFKAAHGAVQADMSGAKELDQKLAEGCERWGRAQLRSLLMTVVDAVDKGTDGLKAFRTSVRKILDMFPVDDAGVKCLVTMKHVMEGTYEMSDESESEDEGDNGAVEGRPTKESKAQRLARQREKVRQAIERGENPNIRVEKGQSAAVVVSELLS